MLHASCHCGAIKITVPSSPEHLIDCNCSICRRIGALWALYESKLVGVTGRPEDMTAYVWGQRSIRTMHCRSCGCVTHWEPISSESGKRSGVNMRNFDPDVVASIRIRKFDGADTWEYLD
jgi:hypothetical protein